ncbi:FAD-binding oxidoreductase [Cellulophaga sp. Hel_I_12]|uniref:NAD(P)/FAD-dependent oxidoreductase n=1 Tax=Cellulophaga sp. Hel_I_12 TaxID=1249972 RepID=UPI0006461504|nr:FAD-dependent oxidoreductase [Cellulophaga sp. Hel_I_12]
MNLSYWEYKTWLHNIDFTIVGSGIVGLNCALFLKEAHPNARILILEKGMLPQGASTKNAGFACFGSISEVLADLQTHSEEDVVQLVQKRWDGVQLLRKNLGDKNIDFQNLGGHEVFLDKQEVLFENCIANLERVNTLLHPVFKADSFKKHHNSFQFKGIQDQYITSDFESQIDTGKMMYTLLKKVQHKGISILNAIAVESFVEGEAHVSVKTNLFEFTTKKLIIATNGFASTLLNQDIKPARAQVLITKPIKNLHVKGTFHVDEGYYYFRNIDDRILFGGGRNLDFKGEETMTFGETTLIQNQLETMLREIILPETAFEIEHRWSGIMGMGIQKRPIIQQLSNHTYCGIRLGGMGIAIGSIVGKELAELI